MSKNNQEIYINCFGEIFVIKVPLTHLATNSVNSQSTVEIWDN